MKLPKRIKVLSETYEVSGSKLLMSHAEARGSCIADDLTIVVDTGLAKSRQRETLHACWDETALRAHEDLKNDEELVVTALSKVLIDVLRRNAPLVDFLLAD